MSCLRYVFLVLMFSLVPNLQAATNDLSSKFDALRAQVQALPLAQPRITSLVKLLDAAEDHSEDGVTSPYAVIDMMNAFAMQVLDTTLVQETPDLLPLIQSGDEISALLFFNAGESLSGLPPLPAPLPGSCTARILFRTVGPFMADPAGTLFVQFAQSLQFEAEVSEPGGTFEWTLNPVFEEGILFREGHRMLMRATESSTFDLRVRYQQGAMECGDIILLQVQGDSPD